MMGQARLSLREHFRCYSERNIAAILPRDSPKKLVSFIGVRAARHIDLLRKELDFNDRKTAQLFFLVQVAPRCRQRW
jgi:hypothetical protein